MSKTSTLLPTGIPSLNRFLGGGWSAGAITSLSGRPGGGKTLLALKSAEEVTRSGREVAMISWGTALFPPAFAMGGVDLKHVLWLSPGKEEEGKWAADQVVRSGLFPLVILSGLSLKENEARRLQLSAEKSGSVILLLRHVVGASLSWPVTLQCEVSRKQNQKLLVRVLRSRKMLPSFSMEVSFDENKNLGRSFEIAPQARVSS